MQTVYIITPVFNGADHIDRSIQHVIMQSGSFRIRYHVQDGGSTDGTVEMLVSWQERLTKPDLPLFCDGIEFSFASETDNSMYEALAKGFAVLDDAPADAFMTWINHDDLLLPGACALAAGLARQFDSDDVAWFTGRHNSTWHNGNPIPQDAVPLPQSFIAQGIADARLMKCIQQEGTFFRKWLWDAADKEKPLEGLRLAGDWNLWRVMAQHAKLYQVEWMQTGRFSYRKGQVSDDRAKYVEEINGIISRDERLNRFMTLVDSAKLVTPCIHFDNGAKKYEKRDRVETRTQMLQTAAGQSDDIQRKLNLAAAHALNETDTGQNASEENAQAAEHVQTSLDRLSRFELMSPKGVKRAVDRGLNTAVDWRKEFIRAPHEVNRWLALRRVERRLKRKKS